LTAACLLALLAAAPPPAAASPADASLQGIPAFRVVVERLRPEIEQNLRVRRDDLQAMVEAQLGRAAIPVTRDADAILYVNVAVACSRLECAFNVAVDVQQKVRLEGRPGTAPLLAATWTAGVTAITERRPGVVRARVRDQVDRLINAYREQNRRK
jgi:hypothetical protein